MLAYDIQEDYEIIEGEKFMAASPNKKHERIVGRLMFTIGTHAFMNKLGFAFPDNLDVHFPDGNILRPDFIFVTAANGKIVFDDDSATLYGVPDIVAEIFSHSTMNRDVGIKKDVYERNGVYLLREGKYELNDIYINYSDKALAELTDEERAEVKSEIPVDVLDGYKVKVRNIFGWFYE